MIGLIAWRELRAQLHGLSLWLLLAATAAQTAWLMFAQLQVYERISPQLLAGQSTLGVNDLVIAPTLNSLALILLLTLPLLCMRALADERRSGRLAVLLSTTLGIGQLLLGKWLGNALAGLLLVLAGLAVPLTLLPGVPLESGRIFAALLSLSLLVMLISAVTLMFSAFSRQAGSAVAASYGLLLFLWLGDSFAAADSAWHWLALNPVLQRGLSGNLDTGLFGYFLTLSGAALLVAAVRLLRDREQPASGLPRLLLFALLLAGCLLSAPRLLQQHSFTLFSNQPPPARALLQSLDALQGPLVITAYAPELPLLHAQIEKLIKPLQEHYPASELRFVDPLKQPQLVRDLGIRRHGELIIEGMGRRQHVRQPDAASLMRAISHIARRGEPWIVALEGHGEAPLHGTGNDGLGAFSAALDQLGYQTLAIDARTQGQVPENAAAVVVAAPAQDYPAAVTRMLADYLAGGGRLLWLQEGHAVASLQQLAGIDLLAEPVSGLHPVDSAQGAGWQIEQNEQGRKRPALFDTSRVLSISSTSEWAQQGRLAAPGTQADQQALGLTLQHGHARIAVVGDSDFARNALFGRAGNQALALGLVNWLTDNRLSTAAAADDISLDWTPLQAGLIAAFDLLLLPLLLLATGLLIRRRRMRA